MERRKPLARGGPLKRTPLKRTGQIKRTPLERGSGGLARSGPLPAKRAEPRRDAPLREGRKRAKKADRDAEWEAFKEEVRQRANGWCIGTPWCAVRGRHEGHTAHHKHQRSLMGTNHPDNGVWVCHIGHDADGGGIHGHIAEATVLGLLCSTSKPWPETTRD